MTDELKPCWTALMDYELLEDEGDRVIVSSQAIHECFKDYLKRGAELNRRAEPSVQEAARVLLAGATKVQSDEMVHAALNVMFRSGWMLSDKISVGKGLVAALRAIAEKGGK